MATGCANPAYKRQEQIAETNCGNLTRQTNPPEIKAQENERNAQAMAKRCTDLSYRMQENERNAQAMATSCINPAYRRQEQIADTNHKNLTRQTNPPEIRAEKMNGMLKLWQQVVLIHHTEHRKMKEMLKL
jgi:hypothetical protein